MPLSESELILNSDGSIYHLNLHPEDIADYIITVGDPERVKMVSDRFDHIELKKGKREFLTHTGTLNNRRISVISTGIGTDNIDIVFNELDALVNIDFESREAKEQPTALNIVRIGTSGAVQPDIPIDSYVLSEMAIGMDGLLHFYHSDSIENKALATSFSNHLKIYSENVSPYGVEADKNLAKAFASNHIRYGITVTNAGFYGPQGRKMRLNPFFSDFSAKLQSFEFEGRQITNLEMETAGIYGLAKLLGHRAVSLNAILANRSTGIFSKSPKKTTAQLIEHALERISRL